MKETFCSGLLQKRLELHRQIQSSPSPTFLYFPEFRPVPTFSFRRCIGSFPGQYRIIPRPIKESRSLLSRKVRTSKNPGVHLGKSPFVRRIMNNQRVPRVHQAISIPGCNLGCKKIFLGSQKSQLIHYERSRSPTRRRIAHVLLSRSVVTNKQIIW
jgi:hypothetical protein